jgi:U3 small nucleolar RNA-associated protein 21
MSLLNIRSTQIVHEFKCIQTNNLTNKCSITTLEPSPAVDTMAVGTSRGTVQLVNLILDKLLFCVNHKSASGTLPTITSVSFRTDAAALQYQIAPMAVGRSDGTVTVWDLTPDTNQGRSILTELNNIHAGGVAMIQYLPREPLLLSIGTVSNSIVLHIFDNANHTGRILRQRRGHTSPPTVIRYLHAASGGLTAHYDGTDAAACQILSSGGMDRTLRIFSTVRSVLDKEYSQGPALEKRARKLGIEKAELLLPPLISMACSEANRRDWGDLVTIHKDHSFAYVWSTKNGSQSGPILRQSKWNVSAMKDPPPRHTNATSVCMSACGHFALVGTQGGVVYKYNVQSGHARGTYPRNQDTEEDKSRTKRNRAPGDINRTIKALEKNMKLSNRVSNLDRRDTDAEQLAKLDERRQAKLQLASHDGYAVTGLAVDSVNKTLISVGKDKKLVLWHFANHAPHKKSPFLLPAPATKLCHIRESDLAAIAMEDFSVVLFDCTSLSIVRRFGAQGMCHHTAPVSDLGFSPDGRTLYSASFDSTLCVYDVPTNTCVDWLSFKSPVTSLTVSPTGEFLATAHVGQLGLNVWSDRSFYQTVHLSGTPPSKPARMDEPVPISDSNEPVEKKKFAGTDEAQHEEDASNEVDEGPPVPKKQGLVTLSGLPPAHWKNLFHLELVKERNKPKEAPKKPPSAPFFLQWRSGESVGGATDELAARENDAAQSGQKAEEESWAAAWSDDDDGAMMGEPALKRELVSTDHHKTAPKRLKVSHARSPLANLLQQCNESTSSQCQIRYQQVTEHVATLGPSGIDLALSSLCNGTHDLDQGLPLLQMACSWLIEACRSGERFEAVNAYLHRFLYLHAPVLAEIEREGDSRNTNGENDQESRRKQLLESVSHLKEAQRIAFEALNNKTQHTLCLLRHVSRMV